MAQTPLRSPINPAELAAIFGEAGELPDAPEVTVRPPRRARRSVSLAERARRLPWWVWLAAGLLVGWLVIGWLIWPVKWTNSDLWDLSPRNQRTVLQLVADRYWTDRDLALAEATLGSWDRADVNSLLVTMQAEIISPEARDRLAALSQALNLPGGQQSLLDSIFNQDGILIAFGIAVLPLFIAIGLIINSQLRARPQAAAGEEALADNEEAELEELLADVQLENIPVGGPGEAAGQQPDQAAAPGEQPPGQTEATGEDEDQEEDENAVDANNPLGDLASLFAEEDTSVAQLEMMCKGLPDVSVDDLLARTREMLRRFRDERPKR